MNIFESLIEISQELDEATRTAFKGGDRATNEFQRKLKEMGMAQEYMKMVRLLKKKGSGFGLFMKEEDRGEEYASKTGIGPSLGFSIEKVNGEKLGVEDVQKRGDTTYKKTLVAMNESVELDEKMKYDPKAYYLLLKGKIYGPYRNSDKALYDSDGEGKVKLGSELTSKEKMKLESVELDEEVSDMQYMMDAYWNYLVDYRASRHGSNFARHKADKPFWQKMVKFYYEGRKKEAERIDSDYGFNQDVYEGIVDKKLPKTPMSYWVAVDGHDRYAKKNNLAESVELDEAVGDVEITYPSSGPAEVFASSMTRKGVKGIVVRGKKVIFNIRDFNKATNIKQPLSHFLDSAKSNGATVKGIGFTLDEVSPPGWEGTVKAMKKKKGDEKIDNPWALAWWMKGKGYKSHYNKDGTKKESVQEAEQWIQKAIKKPGSLRDYFGKEEGEEITKKELDDLIRRLSKEAEGEKKLSSSDRKLLQKANLAKTLRGFKK